jgi:hypothetical protein
MGKDHFIAGAIAALGLAAAASAAGAATLVVNYSEQAPGAGPGGISLSFDQSSKPTPISYLLGGYTQVPIWKATGAFAGLTSVYWYNSAFGGGYDDYGPQTYVGPESAPFFPAPAAYDEYDPNDGLTGTWTFAFAVPEASAWATMLLGIAAVGAAIRLRRLKIAANPAAAAPR